MSNIFEQITRKGLTFSTVKGNISVQELWQLPLKGRNGFDLDTVSRDLLSKVKASSEESLVETVNNVDSDDELRLEVLKVVVNTLKAEQEARVNAEQARSHNEKIDQLIARKQEQELEGKSVEELLAMKK
ncbi:hypothetical protein [Pseudoalteromonas phage PH357]|nr:hypothetical protein [Pseudoalteromonas phage PH357]